MGSKTHGNGFSHTQPRNSSQPNDPNLLQSDLQLHPAATAYQMQPLPQRSNGFHANKSAMTKMPKATPLVTHKSSGAGANQASLYSQSHIASASSQQPKLPEQLQMEVI